MSIILSELLVWNFANCRKLDNQFLGKRLTVSSLRMGIRLLITD